MVSATFSDRRVRGLLASNVAIVNAWYAVARTTDVTAHAPHAVTLLERNLVVWCGGPSAGIADERRSPK